VRDPSNQEAWREFEAKYRDLIVRYCRSRGLQQSDAEDVRQIVMLNLSKFLRNFDYSPARGKFRSYLGRVVRNAISYQFSRPSPGQAALDSSVLAALPADNDAPIDELWETEWINHHYRLAMETIRKTYEPRSVEVFDRLLAGQSVEAVGQAYGMSTQAVHKVKQRIRARMKALVAAQIREEDDPDGETGT